MMHGFSMVLLIFLDFSWILRFSRILLGVSRISADFIGFCWGFLGFSWDLQDSAMVF